MARRDILPLYLYLHVVAAAYHAGYKAVYSIRAAGLFIYYIVRVNILGYGIFGGLLLADRFGSPLGLYGRVLHKYKHRVAENYRVPVRKGAGLVYLFGVYICARL